MTDQPENEKNKRTEAQRNAELRHEQHRIHFKISANLKTNPAYARKFQRYQEANLLGREFASRVWANGIRTPVHTGGGKYARAWLGVAGTRPRLGRRARIFK